MSKMGVQKVRKKVQKKGQKKVKKKLKKKVKKKFQKKVRKIIIKNYKLLEGRGGEGGELSFHCLRPSTKLMAAGKKLKKKIIFQQQQQNCLCLQFFSSFYTYTLLFHDHAIKFLCTVGKSTLKSRIQ
jgi:hypothetical protein